MKPDIFKLKAIALVVLFSVALAQGGSLTDYGSTPALTQPQGSQTAANQKLDFHTDLFTGRFAYQLPVEVPPARGGTEPSVALEYSSANKNSWCGVGWDLDFGYIQRETRYGVPISSGAYSDSYGFTFSFAGHSGRLVSVGGGVYYPQINTDFLKFFYTNGWWTVTDKSGQKYYFGETTGARIANSFGTFKWGLSSIHDPNGNLTLVTYSTDAGQLYLKEIDYNGNTNSSSIATNCTIAFDLESSTRTDIGSSDIAGSEIITEKRLQNIRVLNQGALVRRYNLAYIYSPSSGRSLLQTVTEYGADNSTALPAHTFGYTVQAQQFSGLYGWPITSEGTSHGAAYGDAPANADSTLIDINGDGLPDRVFQPDYNSPFGYYYVQLNNGSSFNSAVAWASITEETSDHTLAWNTVDSTLTSIGGWSQSMSSLLDIDGDGLPDRVARQHNLNGGGVYDHLQVQINGGTGFNTQTSWTGLSSADPTFTGGVMNDAYAKTGDGEGDLATMIDMNGDGLPDRVMRGSSSITGRFDVQFNLNGSFSSVVAWNNVVGDGTYPFTPRCRDYSHVYTELMDMNGDGLPDRVLQGVSGGGVQLNNGHSFDNPSSWNYTGDVETVNVTDGNYTTQLIDMNGDGLPDYVVSSGTGTYTVYFNTGRGFTGANATWTGVNTAGDGTTGWNNLQSWDANGTKTMFIDMNGDGLPDRVIRNYGAVSGNYLLVQYNLGPFPDLLAVVNNGIGGSVDVTYTSSTAFNNSDGTRPRLPFPMNVVTSVVVDDGRGSPGTTSYSYSGGLWNTAYREFRGFHFVSQTDPLGTITYNFFHQGGGNDGSAGGEYQDDLAKAGMPFAIETFGSDTKLYSETFNKVNEVLLTNSAAIYFPFIQQTIKLDFEGNSNYRATAVGYAYNAVAGSLTNSTGNLSGQTNWGEVTNINLSAYTFTTGLAGAPPPVYQQYTYTNIPSNADIRDKLASATTSADAAGTTVLQQTLYQYFDVTGNLKQKSELVCPGTYAVTAYTRDNYGNVATITDPIGIVTTVSYDTTATFPVRKYIGTLANNLIEYTLYDPRSGAILAQTNEQGLVTVNLYDNFLRPTNTAISTTPNGAATLWREQHQYGLGGISGNASLNYVRTLQNDPADSVNGYHETYTYLDGLGRPIQTRDESETNGYRISDLVYDARGAVMLEEYPLFQSGSSYSKPSGTRTNVYTQFDPIGRPFKINPCASASFNGSGWLSGTPSVLSGDTGSPVGPTSIDYNDGSNPWAIVVTNALGKVHKYYEDAFGRTNQIVEVTSAGNFTNTLAYDLIDDLTNITDSAGNKIGFFFDGLRNEVAMTDPDMGFWQFARDADGNLKVQTDAKGQQLKFYYSDPAGRLTRREGYNVAGQLVSTNTWLYDTNNGDTAYTVYPGQVYMVSDDQGWQKSSHDVRNRTTKTVRYLVKNGNTYTNQFTFDDADRAITTIYPNGGPTITNIFDTGENLSQVKQVGGSNTVFYAAKGFNALRQLLGVNFGNGIQTSNFYYSVSKRLQQITSAKTTNVQSLAYTFDAIGNVKGVTDGVYSGSASATFGNILYDDLNRLTSLTNASGSFAYAFDSTGNIKTNTEFGSGAYAYGTIRPHAVKSANGIWLTLDQNGNVANRNGMRLVYDVNNHMAYAVTRSNLTQFGYAADGARLWEQSGTTALQVWIDGNYEEKNGLVLYHIYAGGRQVATFDKTGTNVFQYYHPDDLTSTSIQTDQNGNQIQNYGYSAFGQSRYTQSSTVFKVSRRYTGQVLDDTTGLYYYNARYYDPILARFMQPDDIIPDLSNPQSYNRYAYCINNPLRYTDPSGHNFFTATSGDGNWGLVNGPVPYLSAKSTLGQIGAGAYNVLPLVDNSIYQGLRGVNAVDHAVGDVAHDATLVGTQIITGVGNEQLAQNARNLTLLAGGGIGAVGKIAKAGEAVTTAEKIETGTKITAQNGTKITGFTGHGVDRAIGNGAERQGVSPQGILDALKNPLKIGPVKTDSLGRPSQRFVGKTGEAVVNPNSGKIVSVNPTSSSKAAKLTGSNQ